MHRLAKDCCSRIVNGEVLYVHCWGGHGRTGTLVSVIVGRLYRMTPQQAIQYNQMCHDARVHHQNTRSPQTVVQRLQVRQSALIYGVALCNNEWTAHCCHCVPAAAQCELHDKGARVAIAHNHAMHPRYLETSVSNLWMQRCNNYDKEHGTFRIFVICACAELVWFRSFLHHADIHLVGADAAGRNAILRA